MDSSKAQAMVYIINLKGAMNAFLIEMPSCVSQIFNAVTNAWGKST
jgi:hypothetical protein